MTKTVIGFTGAFGSGCTSAAMHLRDNRAFDMVALSMPIWKIWGDENPGAVPKRSELQRLGDDIRKEHGPHALVDLALPTNNGADRMVVDGIRNVSEVERLKERYGYRFTLVAVLSSFEARWARIGSMAYKGDEDAFHEDDMRDQDEEIEYGQQVSLCMDRADVFLDNSDDVTLLNFHAEVLNVADLITVEEPRPPRDDESG